MATFNDRLNDVRGEERITEDVPNVSII